VYYVRRVELYASGVSGAKRKTPAKPVKISAKRAQTPVKPAKATEEPAPSSATSPEKTNKAELVETLIGKVEQKLVERGEVKASVGDYIKLVQLHKELQDEEAQDIEVRWIDPAKREEEEPDKGT